jgi:hypothetical protein
MRANAAAVFRNAFVAVTILVLFYGSILADAGPSPDIWLAPLDATHTSDRRGSVDYFQLFNADSQWQFVSGHVQFFKVYHFFVTTATDMELHTLLDYLSRHHIQLALEERMLTDDGDCKGDGGSSAAAAVYRLHELGAALAYIAMDEPVFHWRSKTSCHASIERIANNINKTLDKVRQLYPSIQVGDIEPIGGWSGSDRLVPDAIGLHDTFKPITGIDLAFFHADVGWDTQWLRILSELGHQLQMRHVAFGVIYNASSNDVSDLTWATDTVTHFKSFEEAYGAAPDMAVFQSWSPYPTHVLTESVATSLTGIVDTYLRYRRAH